MDTELIRERSYVGCLRSGMSLPLYRWSSVSGALWPELLALALLTGLVAFLPIWLRFWTLLVVTLLQAVVMWVCLNAMIRSIREHGALADFKPRQLLQLVRESRLLIRPRWRGLGRVIGVALFVLVVDALLWMVMSAPLLFTEYVSAEQMLTLAQGDACELPSYFWLLRFLAYAISGFANMVCVMWLQFPLAYAHGSVIADEQSACSIEDVSL